MAFPGPNFIEFLYNIVEWPVIEGKHFTKLFFGKRSLFKNEVKIITYNTHVILSDVAM